MRFSGAERVGCKRGLGAFEYDTKAGLASVFVNPNVGQLIVEK